MSIWPWPKDGAFILEKDIGLHTAVFFVRVEKHDRGHELLLAGCALVP